VPPTHPDPFSAYFFICGALSVLAVFGARRAIALSRGDGSPVMKAQLL
jgi:hypothetical protein